MREELFKVFFSGYSQFMGVELYRSMRPNGKFLTKSGKKSLTNIVVNYVGGRPTQYLVLFFKYFLAIYEYKADCLNNPECQEAMVELNTQFKDAIQEYIKPKTSEKINIMIDFKGENLKVNHRFLQAIDGTDFKETLLCFMDSFNKYSNHVPNNKILSITLPGKIAVDEDNQVLFLQPIIEFYNALSHLYNAYICYQNNEADTNHNVKKAITHLHRGSLDYYKKLIKFVNLDEHDIEKLLALRKGEFESIGSETSNKNKISLLRDYKDFVAVLHSKFPQNSLQLSS